MAVGLLAGCGDDDTPAVDGGTVDGEVMDTGPRMDGSRIPDGSVLCSVDTECDDGVTCTRDICDSAVGYCRHPVDIAVCDDGVFCNGVEQCDSLRGCVPAAMPESCNDDDVCTLDACDEDEKICRHAPRDFDEDGEADWHCEGGTDCDDRNPRRSSLANEVCGDMLDNDCDGDVDEMECGRPAHDACDDPLDVSAGGAFLIDNTGALPDYATSCAGSGRRDVVTTFTLTENRSVRITADGAGVTAVAIQTTCGDLASEIECASGFPGRGRVRDLAAGTYFAIISDTGIGEVEIDVEIGPPEPAPTNETCATPTDVSAGGTFMGSFVDVMDDLSMSCGFGAAPDLVYSFTTTAIRDVRIGLLSTTGETMNFTVRSDCTDSATELRCVRGSPAGTTLHELPVGTWFIIVEGPSFREVDFTLDVEFLPPTPPAMGDTCATAIPLTLGTTTLGTLSDKEDDHDISCGFYYRDAVYSFEITDRSDVSVTVDGGGTFMYSSIRTDCLDGGTQLRCVSGNPSRARLRDLPAGTYYVIAESFRGTGFNITVDATPPMPVTPVTGNDTCTSAHVVPVTGGLFSGDTTGMVNDYETVSCGSMARSPDAVFSLTLTAMKRVLASTDGSSFDSVLHVHQTACASGAEMFCDDDGGDGVSSLIERTFGPGTWYFVVDGFGTSASGAYQFEVLVSDP